MIGFVKILNNNKIYHLNEKAFSALMYIHCNDKNNQELSKDDMTKYININVLIEIVKRYCEENYKENFERKNKMILFLKDYLVMNKNESIENVDELFLNENFEDLRLNKIKFQTSYIQLKKIDKKVTKFSLQAYELNESIFDLEEKTIILNDTLENRIDCVKKLCLEDTRNQVEGIEDRITSKNREIDENISKHDIELDKLKLGIEEQQVKLETNDTKQIELRKHQEKKILQKMKFKFDGQKKRHQRQISKLQDVFTNQKMVHDEELRKIKEEHKEEMANVELRLGNKIECLAKDLIHEQEKIHELQAKMCSIF